MKIFCVLLAAVLSCGPAYAGRKPDVIPSPRRIIYGTGEFYLNKNTVILYRPTGDGKIGLSVGALKRRIRERTGIDIFAEAVQEVDLVYNCILVMTGTEEELPAGLSGKYGGKIKDLGSGGYFLNVDNNIIICGSDDAGAFYGVQTLLQLIGRDETGWSFRCMTVIDEPEFTYRAQHFDPARQFRDMDVLRKYIRIMSAYKMNVMHLHFTDDQSWTLGSSNYDLTVPGRFYTKDDLKRLVWYAGNHFITIVPEIDVPGHSRALCRHHPEVCCSGGTNILCAGREETYSFLDDIFREFMPYFPGEYFHIGADEVARKTWGRCPDCLARMKAEGFTDVTELYFYFVNRVNELVKQHGKRTIIWWEHLPGTAEKLDSGIILEKWHNGREDTVPAAAEKGFRFIEAPYHPLYLSHTDKPVEDIFKKKYYAVLREYPGSVEGISSCSWGDRDEWGEDEVLLPRILAVAEKAWANPWKFTHRFRKRYDKHSKLLQER